MTADQADNFTIVDLQQGSDAWRDWRAGGIGASDAPAIMDENPWKSAQALLSERRNPQAAARSRRLTPAMLRGVELEPKARAAYQKITRADVQPLCLQSREHDWMRCSLDGICLETMQAVEIKCGQSAYKHSARHRSVPPYYLGQLQHTMAVTGLMEMDFFCYLPDRQPIMFSVPRDPAYIAQLIEKEAAFWDAVSR